MHQSIPAVPSLPPPWANPWEFAFFFLWMANSRRQGRLSCQMLGTVPYLWPGGPVFRVGGGGVKFSKPRDMGGVFFNTVELRGGG